MHRQLMLSFQMITLGIIAFAQKVYADVSLGEASENIIGVLSSFQELAFKACYILGSALLLGALIQYRQHRNNPTEVRLSQPVFLLILGLVVILIPFLVKISAGATILTDTT